MFLKSMDLYGFKSFADKTQIEFEPGITVIVGPNGCGKSNVVDAIKWVLGEKQAKNIRGEKMEDIIFAGTEQRKQLSLSEVFITIDNTNRVLDFDSDSVTVGRRIFRDGESEYLINKSPVRLKDVEKLFMDTGIGKSSYSVMEQGKMDLILSTRPEDRRYIFEEAAGISKYKFQKKESLKKLTETSDNLERINDIIKEIEREKDFKSKQAETTKVYLSLKGRALRTWTSRSTASATRSLPGSRTRSRTISKSITWSARSISARVSTTSADNEKDEKRKNDLQHQLFELEKRLHAYRIRVEDIDDKTEKNRALIEEEKALKKGVEEKIVERTKNLDRLLEEKKKSEQSGVEIGRKIEDDRQKLAAFFATRKRKIDSIHASRDSIEEKKRQIKDSDEGPQGAQGAARGGHQEAGGRHREAEGRAGRLGAGARPGADEHRRADRRHRGVASAGRASDIRGGMADERPGRALRSIDMALPEERYTEIRKLRGRVPLDPLRQDRHPRRKGGPGPADPGTRSTASTACGTRSRRWRRTSSTSRSELEDVNQMITRVEKDLSRNENERDWIEKHIQSLGAQIVDFRKQIENYREEIVRADKKIEELSDEIQEWDQRLVEFNERSESLLKEIAELTEKRTGIENKIHERKNVAGRTRRSSSGSSKRSPTWTSRRWSSIFKKNSIEEHLWIEYEKKIKEIEDLNVRDAAR